VPLVHVPDSVVKANAAFRQRLVNDSTSDSYEPRLRQFDAFLQEYYQGVGPKLEGATERQQQEILAHFARDQFERYERRDADLQLSLRAVRWRFQVDGDDERVLDSKPVKNTFKSGRRSDKERREVAIARRATVKLPAGLAFIDDMLRRLEGGRDKISDKNIDAWICYVAAGLSLDAISRVGEISQPRLSKKARRSKKDKQGVETEQSGAATVGPGGPAEPEYRMGCDHMMRAADVAYHVAPADGSAPRWLNGIRACLPYIMEEVPATPGGQQRYVVRSERVLASVLNLYTDKAGHDRFSKYMGRQTPWASSFFDDWITTLAWANAPDEEGIFTRWTNERRSAPWPQQAQTTTPPPRWHRWRSPWPCAACAEETTRRRLCTR
jgi:hypothetical protein